MEYIVVAKMYGDSVQFSLEADSPKDALSTARAEARNIFEYKGIGNEPSVAVKENPPKE